METKGPEDKDTHNNLKGFDLFMKKKLLMVSLSMVMVLGVAGIVNATTLSNNAATMQPKVSNAQAYMENNDVTGTETEQPENTQVDQTIPSTDGQTQNTSENTQTQTMPMNTQTQTMPMNTQTQTQTMPMMNTQTQTMPMNNQMSSQYMQGTTGSNDSNSSETSQQSTRSSSSNSMGSMGRMGR